MDTTLTEDQWQALLPWVRRFKPHVLKAVHAVLVEGKQRSEAREADGLSRQQVHAAVTRVLARSRQVRANIAVESESLPPGWVTRCFDIPKAELETAVKFMAALRAKHLPKETPKGPTKKKKRSRRMT